MRTPERVGSSPEKRHNLLNKVVTYTLGAISGFLVARYQRLAPEMERGETAAPAVTRTVEQGDLPPFRFPAELLDILDKEGALTLEELATIAHNHHSFQHTLGLALANRELLQGEEPEKFVGSLAEQMRKMRERLEEAGHSVTFTHTDGDEELRKVEAYARELKDLRRE